MILSLDDIKRIIKNNPNEDMINAAQSESKKLTQHITGKGSDDLLSEVSGLENKKQLELRKKYAQSNVDIFARLHRPEDKIFTAKGGSTFYDIGASSQKQLIEILNDIYNGYSVRNWVEVFAKQYFHTDPMGLVFMEVGDNETYPTYKSISVIFDYQLKGRDVEYVVFRTDEKDQFRVVDDAFDYLVRYDGEETVTVIQDKTFKNYFGKVPAIVISDIKSKTSETFVSPDAEVIEIADQFLRERSVKTIFKLKHGFPKAWQYQTVCSDCKGSGHKHGEDCKTCNGTGKSVTQDSSQIITLPIPLEGQPTISPDIAGYSTPDIEGWTKMSEELKELESSMHSTYWGKTDEAKTNGLSTDGQKTATEIVSDMQPMNDRLERLSKWAESIEKFVTDKTGKFYFENTYKGCSINLGRRYLIEGPDVIWKKYQEARSKGSPTSVLDELLAEYYYSKYQNNAIELNKHLKLMRLEPFVHLTIGEAKSNISNFEDFNKKLYFGEWLNQLPDNEILIKKLDQLNISLSEYVKAKNIQEPQPIIK
ncbi:MAG TPA: hypothetical protein VGF79_00880 [Bacteroidia bacterium]